MPKVPQKPGSNERTSPYPSTGDTASDRYSAPIGEDAQSTSTATQSAPPPKATTVECYTLLVRLTNSSNPVITRLLSVPSNFTFSDFHDVLQIAFGWANCHMYKFEVSKLLEEGESPNFMTGRGQHLLRLGLDEVDFPPRIRTKRASDYTLEDIYDSEEFKGKIEIAYEYDFGDSWDHQIVFLGRTDPSARKAMDIEDDCEVVCLAGEGHPCAEDCGSSSGWEALKNSFKKKGDPDERKAWYKNYCTNGDPKGLDPYEWDILEVNDQLAKIKRPKDITKKSGV